MIWDFPAAAFLKRIKEYIKMSIDIKEIMTTLKNDILGKEYNCIVEITKDKMIYQALEQQQLEVDRLNGLLNKIHIDLIKRADLKGDVCVDLSDGIWMTLCATILKKQRLNHEYRLPEMLKNKS